MATDGNIGLYAWRFLPVLTNEQTKERTQMPVTTITQKSKEEDNTWFGYHVNKIN